jgi:threonine synthase
MGLPIDRLVIAINENDVLDRALKTGRFQVTGPVTVSNFYQKIK